MFFMISGYVILSSLKRHVSLKSFFIDRAIRIYPTWIPILLSCFIFMPIIGRDIFAVYDPVLWAQTFVSNLFFLPPILPFPIVFSAAWSLNYEWCFYLVSALFVFVLREFVNLRICKLIFLSAIIAGIAVFLNLFPRGLFFIPGVLAFIFEDKLRQYTPFLKFPLLSLGLFLLTWSLTGITFAQIDISLLDLFTEGSLIYAVLALIFSMHMFLCIVFGTGQLSYVLRTQVMQFYGKISYGFYFWSLMAMFPIKIVANKVIMPAFGDDVKIWFFAITSLVLATLISWLNYVIIEKKFAGYLKRKISPPERMGSGI